MNTQPFHPRRPTTFASTARPDRDRRTRCRPEIAWMIICITLVTTIPGLAQHGHYNAGVESSQPGSRLAWVDYDELEAIHGFVRTLTYTNGGTYAGYWQGSLTFTALPATEAHAGPDPKAASLGSDIWVEITAVEGPLGGAFGFWEAGATGPTVTATVGGLGSGRWRLSEGEVSATSDPYGHAHGRRFTATAPGLYKVWFRAVDLSTNGPDGGPLHPASEPAALLFQAGVSITSTRRAEGTTQVTFGAPSGGNWQLESRPTLGDNAAWQPVEAPVAGSDHLATVSHPSTNTARFYRVRNAE